MGNVKLGRPPITGFEDALDAWDRYDRDATSEQIAALLNAAGLEVSERTVRAKRRRSTFDKEQRPQDASKRARNPLTLNTGLAAHVLERHGATADDARLMLAVASADAFSDVQWEVFVRASKDAGSMTHALEHLEARWDETGVSNLLAQRLATAVKQVRTRAARAKPASSEQRAIQLTDPSPPCTQACEGNASPHRHCVVCGRTWTEDALQFGPVCVAVTSGHEDSDDHRDIMYRYAVRRDERVEWTGDPDRADAFMWACATCKRAAVSALPPSTERNKLLRTLGRDDRRAKALVTDNTFERGFRRVPGLWPWTEALYRIGRDATVLVPIMPRLTARLPSGDEIVFGVSVRIAFAPYAEPGAMFCMLHKVQQLVAMDLPTIAARAREAQQRGAKLPDVWHGSLRGFPSLGVFTVTMVIGLHDFRPRR